jgi:hypothetical protein
MTTELCDSASQLFTISAPVDTVAPFDEYWI